MLKNEIIEKYNGVKFKPNGRILPLKKGYWRELNFFPGGDAPKNFIAVYQYKKDSNVRKSNPDSWPRYIAKVGHKWYPFESINEFLFNRIGEVLELRMASSQLMMAGKQLRFISKYFLTKTDSLEHGAQIFAGYLNDLKFVEKIEQQGLARKFFTFQFAEKAIKHMFANEAEIILTDFVKMLIFDAITGNNDRHFYNWGVIKDISNRKVPTFAPIYDSARGLFWNESEPKLLRWFEHTKQVDEKIKKYSEGSRPKIGWDGLDDLNHFDLIERIFSLDSRYIDVCTQLINHENLERILKMIEIEFSDFFNLQRQDLIKKCLTYRFDRLIEIINNKGGVSC